MGRILVYRWEALNLISRHRKSWEGAQHRQIHRCQRIIKIWSWAPDGARHQDGRTDWLTDRPTDRPSVVTWHWFWLRLMYHVPSCPYIVQFVWKWCSQNTWYLSSPLCPRHLSVCNRSQGGFVLRKLQRCLSSVETWCERWNIKINIEKSQAIYFSRRFKPTESHLTLNGRNIPFANGVKYLCVISYRKITWRFHIEVIEAKAFRTFIRIYSLLKTERLSASIIWILHKALIKSIMTYVCPAWICDRYSSLEIAVAENQGSPNHW
jgi:hypothetical protein